LRQFHAPPVAKFAIVSAIGVVVSFGLASAIRQLPLVKRVF